MQHKYFFLTVLAFLSICQIGSALECYTCVDNCNSLTKATCPPLANQCMSVSVKNGNFHLKLKTCADIETCNQDYSIPGQVSAKPTCCGTDLCNSAFNNMMSLGTALLLPLVSLYLSQF